MFIKSVKKGLNSNVKNQNCLKVSVPESLSEEIKM